MIEQQTIDGELAWVAYLTDKLEPATRETATLVKVILADRVLFLVPQERAEPRR